MAQKESIVLTEGNVKITTKPVQFEPKAILMKPAHRDEIARLQESIGLTTNSIIDKYMAEINKIFEKAVRENAVPPIKGPITKGKLKWRGIRLVSGPYGLLGQTTHQLFQRKKPISKAIIFVQDLYFDPIKVML